MTKLLKDSTKFESRSTPDHKRYGKLGDWTSAKKDFLDIVEPGSIRTHVNNIRIFGQGIRKVTELKDQWSCKRSPDIWDIYQ